MSSPSPTASHYISTQTTARFVCTLVDKALLAFDMLVCCHIDIDVWMKA